MVNPNANELTVESYFEYACPADDLAPLSKDDGKGNDKAPRCKIKSTLESGSTTETVVAMVLVQIKRAIWREKWFNYVTTFFVLFVFNAKTLGWLNDVKRRIKKGWPYFLSTLEWKQWRLLDRPRELENLEL